jgi:hypothetical protein
MDKSDDDKFYLPYIWALDAAYAPNEDDQECVDTILNSDRGENISRCVRENVYLNIVRDN